MMKTQICLALDGLGANLSSALTTELGHLNYAVKVHDLVDLFGPGVIHALRNAGAKRVWVDYKVHDTKGTVGLRVKALAEKGARIITVHASGGVEMMQAAVEAARPTGCEIWAITVLTSLSDEEIGRIYGRDRTRMEIVHEFALMGVEAGVQGVVCSAEEVGMLSGSPQLASLKFTVPGTRSKGVALGQQKRSGTPEQAAADGATYLVAGSQVTGAENSVAAFKVLAAEIGMILE